ncbi:MAG TPA: Uma2 family endonuclease [Tepidisphaeraceae bacterium]|nr:Uma2 family endonuclease [Tepidisphaeraceae bacterium]
MTIKTAATVKDLYRVDGKAELVRGELVHMPATGRAPGFASDEILVSLKQYVKRTRHGVAVGDNKGFLVDLPHLRSFSPDAALYVGPNSGMKFFEGAPVFAAEVRSEGDYGPAADAEMAAKRADYFAAGTLVVWDVDVLGRDVVRVYRASEPGVPAIYRKGQLAEAEPAVPGWSMPVDDLFEPT